MFDNNMFEDWLDSKAAEVLQKVGRNESIRSEEMMILVLKAQANHFMHLDTDLRKDMKDLREDMKDLREDMKDLREDMNRRFEASREDMKEIREEIKDLREDMKELREDTNRRFEASREDMNRRFISIQWLIGLGIAFLTVLMSLYRFFQ